MNAQEVSYLMLKSYCIIVLIVVYRLQQEAPKPHAIPCSNIVPSRPPYYGSEYHGVISHAQAANLLENDGDYLVRLSGNSENQTCTLSMQ